MHTKPRKQITVLSIILMAAAVLYLSFILQTSFRIKGQTYFTLIDDAMVSMRYAQHLAHGQGLVWNIGEKPVEGFTNPGWMLYMSFWHLFQLSGSQISLLVMLTSALVLLANILIVHRICQILQPESKYAPLLAATLTAFYFPLIFWSLRGMEVGILTLLVDLAVLLSIRFTRAPEKRFSLLLSLVFIAALIIRMDVLLPILLLVAYLVWKSRSNLRLIALPLLSVLVCTLAILWFQRIYFGDFLPNTYYQKVTGVATLERVKNGILFFYHYARQDVWMPVLLSVIGIAISKNLRNPENFLLAGLFLAQCAYSIWVGGDYADEELNAANRFITQGMPALFILFGLVNERFLSDLLSRRLSTNASKAIIQSGLALTVALISLFLVSGGSWFRWRTDNAPLLQSDIRRVKLGLSIAQNTSPQATIAVHAAGQIPYYSERRTIDLLGLNDPVVAREAASGAFYPGHDKWDYAYSILQLKPDLIADRWIKLGDFMKGVSEYQELDNGMYARVDSTLINLDGLAREDR